MTLVLASTLPLPADCGPSQWLHLWVRDTGPGIAADIIERVYRQPLPNRFLASFAPFLADNIHEEAIEALVIDGFRRFLTRNVKQYEGWNQLPVGFNGSIAQVFQPQLEKALQEQGMHLGRIIKAPMEGLVDYHNA